MSLDSVQTLESRHLMATYDRFPVLFREGRGVCLIDEAGRSYLDFLGGIGVNVLGYGHPAITAALTEQAGKVLHVPNLYYHDHQGPLAKQLAEISGLDRVFFTNSGTEAIETAIKLARAYAKQSGAMERTRLLALDNSFHGRSLGALSITGQPRHRAPFEPLLPDVAFVAPNDVGDLENKLDGTVSALIMEPIQGEGGIRLLTPDFMQAARRLTQRHGALLILDEIQTGLGRTGQWFAYQHHDLHPDIVTIAKPLAAGLPLGAILATGIVAAAFRPGMHGTTFGGGPLPCAVARAVLTTLQSEDMPARVRETGTYLRQQLTALAAEFPWVREVRGRGLMLGMELDLPERAKAVVCAALTSGLVINRTADTVLRFLPPYIIQKDHIAEAMRILHRAFTGTKGGVPCTAPRPSLP